MRNPDDRVKRIVGASGGGFAIYGGLLGGIYGGIFGKRIR